MGLEHKGSAEFLDLRDCVCIEIPKGLQGTSGVRIDDETITVVEGNTRKGEEYSI